MDPLASLHNFPPFEVHANEANLSPRWTKWLERFERFMCVADVKDDTRKRAALLHYAGPEVDEIFSTLPDTGETKEYAKATAALDKYFKPKCNIAFETYKFHTAEQDSSETIDQFHVRLRKLAQTCEFHDVEKEIHSQIVLKCTSKTLRRRAMRETMTLTKLLEFGRSLETSEQHAKTVETSKQSANAVSSKGRRPPQQQRHGHGKQGHKSKQTIS